MLLHLNPAVGGSAPAPMGEEQGSVPQPTVPARTDQAVVCAALDAGEEERDLTLPRAEETDRTRRLRLALLGADSSENWPLVALLELFVKLSETDGCVPRYRDGVNHSVVAHMADIGSECLSEKGPVRDALLLWLPEFPLSEESLSVRDGKVVDTGYIRERVRRLARFKAANNQNFRHVPSRPNSISKWALADELRVDRDDVNDPALSAIIRSEGPFTVPMAPWTGEQGIGPRESEKRQEELWPFAVAWKNAGRPLPCKPGRPNQTDWRRFERGLDGDAPPGKTLAFSYAWKKRIRKLFDEKPAPEGAMSARQVDWATLAAAGEAAVREAKAGQATLEKAVGKMTGLLERIRNALGAAPTDPVGVALDGDADALTKSVMGVTDAELVGNVKRNHQNLRGLVNEWSSIHAGLLGSAALPDTIEASLEYLCRLHRVTLVAVAEGTGIPHYDLVEWRAGRMRFNPTRIDDAKALERFFGREDELVQKIRDNGRRRRRGVVIPEGLKDIDGRVWAYISPEGAEAEVRSKAEVVKETILRQPRLATEARRQSVTLWQENAPTKAEVRTGRLATELEQLKLFRTAIDTGGQRRGRPVDEVTADIFDTDLTMSMRWLALDTSHGGVGVQPEALSIAALANPQNLVTNVLWRSHRLQHVEYKGEKRGVVATVKEQQLLHGAAQMMRDPTGWFRQNAAIFRDVEPIIARLPTYPEIRDSKGRPLQHVGPETDLVVLSEDIVRKLRSGDVADLCNRAEARYREFAIAIEGIVDRTRDSWVPVLDMLKQHRPMVPFWEQVYLARDRYADKVTQPAWYMKDVRDQVLVELYGIVPLRSFTMGSLEFLKNNSGHLKFDGNTVSLTIEPDLFKNRRSKRRYGPPAKRRPFEREIPNVNGFHDFLRHWCFDLLPFLRRTKQYNDQRCLWPSGQGNRLLDDSMNAVVVEYTQAHFVHNPFDPASRGIPGVMFFGPQAIRSLAATDKVREFPGMRGFGEAADLLYTSVDMVMDDYGKIDTVIEQSRFDERILANAAEGARLAAGRRS